MKEKLTIVIQFTIIMVVQLMDILLIARDWFQVKVTYNQMDI